jgi:hypothetical protein
MPGVVQTLSRLTDLSLGEDTFGVSKAKPERTTADLAECEDFQSAHLAEC